MSHVHASAADLLGEMNVALYNRHFRLATHATQTQTERGWPIIHGAVPRNACIFCMLNHRKVEFRSKPQSFAHDVVVEDGLAVVSDGDCARALQREKIRRRDSLAALRRGGDGKNIHDRAALVLQ